ncbi:MAG: hypothetical protein AAF604_09615 [Acidobacteriota bacterium]
MKKALYTIILISSLIANIVLCSYVLYIAALLDGADTVTKGLWERRQMALKIINYQWTGKPRQQVDEMALELEE